MSGSTDIHFSSKDQTWETPIDFFNKCNDVFNFTLDACADDTTFKVDNYYTEEDNALNKDWIGSVWCNPPYGKYQIDFVKKALSESVKHNSVVVMLIPARTETKVWQDIIFKHANTIVFVKSRLKFGGSKYNAPFPSALVIFGDCDVDLNHIGKQFYI